MLDRPLSEPLRGRKAPLTLAPGTTAREACLRMRERAADAALVGRRFRAAARHLHRARRGAPRAGGGPGRRPHQAGGGDVPRPRGGAVKRCGNGGAAADARRRLDHVPVVERSGDGARLPRRLPRAGADAARGGDADLRDAALAVGRRAPRGRRRSSRTRQTGDIGTTDDKRRRSGIGLLRRRIDDRIQQKSRHCRRASAWFGRFIQRTGAKCERPTAGHRALPHPARRQTGPRGGKHGDRSHDVHSLRASDPGGQWRWDLGIVRGRGGSRRPGER